jgi:hypothetical protein
MYKAAGAPGLLAVIPKVHYFERFYKSIWLRPNAKETPPINNGNASINIVIQTVSTMGR